MLVYGVVPCHSLEAGGSKFGDVFGRGVVSGVGPVHSPVAAGGVLSPGPFAGSVDGIEASVLVGVAILMCCG